jgi:uncharacterized protein YebE (UPF0316 family)
MSGSQLINLIVPGLMVFSLRILDITFYTLRIRMVFRGKRKLAWIFGFSQALVYVGAISLVISNLEDIINILGYAAGFATGLVVGMMVEDRLAIGYTHLRIVSQFRGFETAEGLRQAGFGATEVPGHGKDGALSIIHCSILRRNEEIVKDLVNTLDPKAFITAENVLQVKRGFWHT